METTATTPQNMRPDKDNVLTESDFEEIAQLSDPDYDPLENNNKSNNNGWIKLRQKGEKKRQQQQQQQERKEEVI